MSIANSLSSKLPADYREVLYWKITETASRGVVVNLMSIPLALIFGAAFFVFARIFGKPPRFILSGGEMLVVLIGAIIVIVSHEFVHGIAMQMYGGKAQYGFWRKGLMFYATAPGHAFKRNQYIIIILGPLVSLSVLACCGIAILSGSSMIWLLLLWGTVNASTAGADLWIAAIVLRYPASTYVVNERDGMRIFLPQAT